MFTQKELVENICEQIYYCLLDMRATNSMEHRLLTLQSNHLDLLLKLLQSEIDIKSYLEEYSVLFSNEEQYISPNVYTKQLAFLEEHQSATVSTDNEVCCFIDVLQICNDNIKRHIDGKNYEAIKDEANYNHNVPSLIITKNIDLIEHYLSKCGVFQARCSKEVTQPYENIWQQVSRKFLP